MLKDIFFAKGQTPTTNPPLSPEPDIIPNPPTMELPVDLVRSGNQLIARFPIAGGSLHDIGVTVTPRRLTVTKSNWRIASSGTKEHYYMQECHWGELSRTVELPKTIDPDRTRATLDSGILTVVMPLAATSHTTMIKVNEE